MEGLKTVHEVEIENFQQKNQQFHDQADDLKEHMDQLAHEMISNESDEDPREDPMEYPKDDGELTYDIILDWGVIGNELVGIQLKSRYLLFYALLYIIIVSLNLIYIYMLN